MKPSIGISGWSTNTVNPDQCLRKLTNNFFAEGNNSFSLSVSSIVFCMWIQSFSA